MHLNQYYKFKHNNKLFTDRFNLQMDRNVNNVNLQLLSLS